MTPDKMEVGNRYRVYHKSGTQRIMRYSVMDYLGRDEHESYAGQGPNYSFNARPLAGTQSMPPSWIQSIVPVAKSAPIVLNKIAR
jgi:hypothetical protein